MNWQVLTFARVRFPTDVIVVGDRIAIGTAEGVVVLDDSGSVLAERSFPSLLGIASLEGSLAICSLELGVLRTDLDLRAQRIVCPADVLRSSGVFVNDQLSPTPRLVTAEHDAVLLDRRRKLWFDISSGVPVPAHGFPDMTSLANGMLVDACIWRDCVVAAVIEPPDVVRLCGGHAESVGGNVLRNPRRLITDGETVFVLDRSRILAIGRGTIETIAGVPNAEDAVDGPGAVARFALGGRPGLALRGDGALLVADTGNDSIRLIRKV